MKLETAIQIATLASVIIGFVSLVFAIRSYRRQLNAQILITYAERYEHVMDAFPENAFTVRFDFEHNLPPSSEKLTLCILKYLNLSSEEFYLWEKGYIANDVWSIWEGELKRMLRSDLLKREWKRLKSEFETYPDFLSYVEKQQESV